MHHKLMSRFRSVVRSWVFWLVVVTAVAILVRSIPAWTNAAWGCDFGIYYGLTNQFIESKELINAYSGWGSSYQYFPVLYAVTGLVHFVSGLDVLTIMPKLAPVIGGLTIPLLFFIVADLLKDKKVALLSAGLLSVATFHVYQTSHAAPLTVGHFFMLLSLYLFVKFLRKKTFVFPLLVSTSLLVLSHHFTTYFYIITVTCVFFAHMWNKDCIDKQDFWKLGYVAACSLFAFGYWAFVAKPVFYGYMAGNLMLPPLTTVILYYTLLFGVFTGITILKKHGKPDFFIRINLPKVSLKKSVVLYFGVLMVVCGFICVAGVPGVHVRVTPLAVLYSLPMILLASLAVAGFPLLRKSRGGMLIFAWFLAVSGSFIYSLVSADLLPDRHLEYLIVPMCVPAAFVIKQMLEQLHLQAEHDTSMSIASEITSRKMKHYSKYVAAISIVVALGVANVGLTYPSIDALNALDERVTTPCINVVEWMDGNISGGTVASDHRISMLLWAHGFSITMGDTNHTWTAANLSGAAWELQRLNISYIVIDDIMKEKVVNVDVGHYYYMTQAAYTKFKEPVFDLVYRNATVNSEGEEIHWTEVYAVNTNLIQQSITKNYVGWSNVIKNESQFYC